MTDLEYRIIDELYFVASFNSLLSECGIPAGELGLALRKLVTDGLVKVFFPDPDTEVALQEAAGNINLQDCFFLATKAGLLAHNSR